MTDFFPDFLHAFLAGRDVACPGCGYNLRDLSGSRCPECGDEVVLRVGLAEPGQSAGIAGFIGLAAGAGLNGLLFGSLVIRRLVFGDSFGGMDRFVGVNLGGLVVEAIAVTLWLRNWRRVRRLGPTRKWMLAGSCWAVTLLNLIVFSLAVK